MTIVRWAVCCVRTYHYYYYDKNYSSVSPRLGSLGPEGEEEDSRQARGRSVLFYYYTEYRLPQASHRAHQKHECIYIFFFLWLFPENYASRRYEGATFPGGSMIPYTLLHTATIMMLVRNILWLKKYRTSSKWTEHSFSFFSLLLACWWCTKKAHHHHKIKVAPTPTTQRAHEVYVSSCRRGAASRSHILHLYTWHAQLFPSLVIFLRVWVEYTAAAAAAVYQVACFFISSLGAACVWPVFQKTRSCLLLCRFVPNCACFLFCRFRLN